MGASEFIAAAIPIFLSIFVPGVAIAYPLLRKSKLSLIELLCFGFALGLVVPTTVTYIGNLAGVPFSLGLVFAGIAITTGAGAIWTFYEWRKSPGDYKLEIPSLWFSPKRDALALILLAVMFFAFFIRIQSIGPFFYEFDPYFYMYIARQLIVVGHVPLVDWSAWYPGPGGHGPIQLTGYLEAGWYAIYSGGTSNYNNLLLSTIANVYPPVVAALICFFAYMLVKEEYGTISGIIAAGFMAITPRLIEKLAAGEAEITPWGMFSLFFFAAAYAMAIKRSDRRLAIVAGIACLSAYLGSAYSLVVTLVFLGYSLLETLRLYFMNKNLRTILEINSIVVGFMFIAYLLRDVIYTAVLNNGGLGLPAPTIITILSVLGIGALHYIELNSKKIETRYNLGLALILAGFIIVLVTPLGNYFFSYAFGAVGFAKPNSELMQTVAEEHPLTPSEFAGDAKRAFGALGTLVTEIVLQTDSKTGKTDGIPLGTAISLGDNQVYMPFLLIVTFIGLCYALIRRHSSLALFFIVLIFPVAFVGLQKSKYTVQFGFMLVIAAAVMFGELYMLLMGLLSSEESKKYLRISYVLVAFGLLAWGAYGPVTDVMPTALTFSQGDCSKISADMSAGGDRYLSLFLYCNRIPAYWLDSMDWISHNVEKEDAVMSWWDYGHWTNFFGDRRTVTRNEHANSTMDLVVADAFVEGTPEDLKASMIGYNATHALFDVDLIGKWGALKYLSCVYNKQTNMSLGPGNSQCDALYDFEYVFVPIEPTINERCMVNDGSGQYLLLGMSSFNAYYCIQQVTSGNNQLLVMYNTNESNPPDSFDLEKATMNQGIMMGIDRTTMSGRTYARFMIIYPEEGYADRKGKAYNSNFYKGFFLGKLDGFDLVYPENSTGLINFVQTSDPVRIFKIRE